MKAAQAKKIYAAAVAEIPNSVRVWCAAANLEKEKKSKRRVYQKALENIPNAVRLWKAAVELEDEDDAKFGFHKKFKRISTYNNVNHIILVKTKIFKFHFNPVQGTAQTCGRMLPFIY